MFEKIAESTRVFKLKTENKKIINKKFNNLTTQEKLKYFKKIILYIFSIFVVWITIHMLEKFMKKNKVVVDIREFNKIIEFDAYSMSLQTNIISCLQKCKFILLMNEIVFFHQWSIVLKNRHKLIVVTHRDAK